MNLDWNQAAAVGALATFALVGLALLYALLHLARGAAWWISGAQRASHPVEPAARGPGRSDPVVTAADLLAIRSNLMAVTRQIEDLERRIRLSGLAAPKPSQTPGAAARTHPSSA